MEKEILVVAKGVSKKFCRDLKTGLWYGLKDLATELFGVERKSKKSLRKKEFWAVEDLSFTLRRGECLGLIGHNGAGKSTLLKMLNGLIEPDKGSIRVYGRVAAIIELGAGFNPILTGRENIYNNAAVLGIPKKEIESVLDDIIAFSELEKFIDTPVQYYSSGMKVRLGFSVAVHMKPDVLILDEVLAVGDAGFRIKSFNAISRMIQNAAVIFVSHSMPSIARICTHALFMSKGKKRYYGENVNTAVEEYFADFEGETSLIEYSGGAEIRKVYINGNKVSSEKLVEINHMGDLTIELEILLKDLTTNFYVMVQITDKDMKIVGQHFTNRSDRSFKPIKHSIIRLEFPEIQFIDGEYAITYFIVKTLKDGGYTFLATYRYYSKFKVIGLNDTLYGSIHMKGKTSQIEIFSNLTEE